MVHDLAESLVGDITPYDGVSKEDKRKLEEVKESLTLFKLFNWLFCRSLFLFLFFINFFITSLSILTRLV